MLVFLMMCDVNAFNSFSIDKDVPCCWRFGSIAISFCNLSICVTFKPVLDNITIGGFGRTLSYIILHDFRRVELLAQDVGFH